MQIIDNLGKHAKDPNTTQAAPHARLPAGFPWSVYTPPYTKRLVVPACHSAEVAPLGQQTGRVFREWTAGLLR